MIADRQPLFWPKGQGGLPAPTEADRLRLAMGMAEEYACFASRCDDLDELQRELCVAAIQRMRPRSVRLLERDAVHQAFLVRAGVGWQADLVGSIRPDAGGETAACLAVRTGRTVIVADTVKDGAHLQMSFPAAKRGVGSILSVPIPGDGEVAFGVLEMQSRNRGEFGAEDGQLLRLLAQSFAAARTRILQQASFREAAARAAQACRASLHEMQHRVRNDLQGISSSLNHEARAVPGTEERVGLDRVNRRVLALAALYGHLCGQETGDLLDLGAFLGALCSKIMTAADLPSRGLTVMVEAESVFLPTSRAGQLAIAVNELVTNAATHAFAGIQAGRIIVSLQAASPAEGNAHVLTVSDNGTGFKGPRPGGAGIGFVEQLVRAAGGTITRVDGQGTQWRIALQP